MTRSGPKFKPLLPRFTAKYVVDPVTKCWIWTAAKYNRGYGKIEFLGKTKRAHRISFELFRHPIKDADLVLHRCDTPECVNPEHLFLGSHADNVADKCAKGRQPRGETNGASTLTEKQVLKIISAPGTHASIAKKFGCSRPHVTDIKNGKTWKHIHESV